MAKRQKRIHRLFAMPPPKDFTWEELVTVMKSFRFDARCEDGSHYEFVHETGFSVHISRPHPKNILKRYQIDAAKEAINQVTPDGNDPVQGLHGLH